MRRRLLVFNIIAGLLVLTLMFCGGVYTNEKDNERIAKESVQEYALFCVSQLEEFGEVSVPKDSAYRVSIVKIDGTVVFDSEVEDISAMENHLDREEISCAIAGEPTTVLRYSSTMGTDMMYHAMSAEYEGEKLVVRVSRTVDSVQAYLYESMPILLGVLLCVGILSVFMAVFFGRQTLRPLEFVKKSLWEINRGEYTSVFPSVGDEEINQLLVEINDINETIVESFQTVKAEREKLNYVLDNIADGIVAIDSAGGISTINKSAQTIFGVTDITVGKQVDYLSSSGDFLKKMHSSESQIFEIEIAKKSYLCFLNFLDNMESAFSRVLVIRDITSIKNAETMRGEFFANASHELKTPLTVVSGFVEILAMNEGGEKQSAMLEKIMSETARMKTLIDDMLALSDLESGNVEAGEKVLVAKVCEEVFDTLSILSYRKNIKLICEGEAEIVMVEKHLYELLKNLVENGVKYNDKKSGFVKVKIFDMDGAVRIVVSDNGIGIGKKHQGRIFERFYRVEKSRSRATGGTGLGLSIVKHIAESRGGDVSITSSQALGTTITVNLKK